MLEKFEAVSAIWLASVPGSWWLGMSKKISERVLPRFFLWRKLGTGYHWVINPTLSSCSLSYAEVALA